MRFKLKPKIHFETNMEIPNCWTNEAGYTVALCGIGEDARWMITAPKDRAAFAYTPNKKEVRKIILIHSQQADKN